MTGGGVQVVSVASVQAGTTVAAFFVLAPAIVFFATWTEGWNTYDRKRQVWPADVPRAGNEGTLLVEVDADLQDALAAVKEAARSMGAHEVEQDDLLVRGWIGTTSVRHYIGLKPPRLEYELGATSVGSVDGRTTLLCYGRPRLVVAGVDRAYAAMLASTLAERTVEAVPQME